MQKKLRFNWRRLSKSNKPKLAKLGSSIANPTFAFHSALMVKEDCVRITAVQSVLDLA